MLKRIVQSLGLLQATIFISGGCVAASVLIAATFWSLTGQTNLGYLIIVAIICPAVIAPPIIYSYSRLLLRLDAKGGELRHAINELKSALSEVRELKGFLPICSSCKKIRDDQGYWNQIEAYIQSHSKAEFTHGMCPDCAHKICPELPTKQ